MADNTPSSGASRVVALMFGSTWVMRALMMSRVRIASPGEGRNLSTI